MAYEEGRLDSLFSLAAMLSPVPASQPGAVFGYPLSARTGVAGVDRVLTALDAQDPGGLQSLFILQKLPASDGELVDALPTLTCGNGDSIAIAPQVLPATAADLLGERIYAVFTIAPAAGPWLAFSGATHAIVLSGAGGGGYPRSSMIAVNAQGIVGAGRPCGAPPTFYLRDDRGVLARASDNRRAGFPVRRRRNGAGQHGRPGYARDHRRRSRDAGRRRSVVPGSQTRPVTIAPRTRASPLPCPFSHSAPLPGATGRASHRDRVWRDESCSAFSGRPQCLIEDITEHAPTSFDHRIAHPLVCEG